MTMKAPTPLPENAVKPPAPPPPPPKRIIKEDVWADTGYYIIRKKDYDGMGEWEYEYFCGNCNRNVETDFGFCPRCGVKLCGIKDK